MHVFKSITAYINISLPQMLTNIICISLYGYIHTLQHKYIKDYASKRIDKLKQNACLFVTAFAQQQQRLNLKGKNTHRLHLATTKNKKTTKTTKTHTSRKQQINAHL